MLLRAGKNTQRIEECIERQYFVKKITSFHVESKQLLKTEITVEGKGLRQLLAEPSFEPTTFSFELTLQADIKTPENTNIYCSSPNHVTCVETLKNTPKIKGKKNGGRCSSLKLFSKVGEGPADANP